MMVEAIIEHLQVQHSCTVMLPKLGTEYIYKGIKVIPRCGNWSNYDAIFCQLDTTKESILLSKGKPLFWIQHNTFAYPSVEEAKHINIIANSVHGSKQFPYHDTFILPPPVDYTYYNAEPGECITLINCNENKGGKIVHEIAKRMPQYKFLQVIGSYGTQFVSANDSEKIINIENKAIVSGLGQLPNVDILPTQSDIREVYKRTKILLMPSAYESWGRTATEAMCSGIPVIASTAIGLKENIGEDGIFVCINNIDNWVKEIERLQGKKEYKEASDYARSRAKELNPTKKLEQLNSWIKKKIYGIQSNH